MGHQIQLNPIPGVVALVDTEVSATRVIVEKHDAGEAPMVIEGDVGDSGLHHLVKGFLTAKRFVRFI
jgi:hypothetical protein